MKHVTAGTYAMPNTKRPNFTAMFVSVVVVVLFLCAAYTLGVWHTIPKAEDRAHFGEMYGGLAALFSGLAFAGVIVAIAMQREELRLQRKELKLTRGELKRQATAQESSSRAVESQVQLMLVAAKLNAHATLLDYYADQLASPLGLPNLEPPIGLPMSKRREWKPAARRK